MKHFSDDGCNKQPDYDYNIFHRSDDEKNDDYDKPIAVHFEPLPDDWYEGIKHFQD